MSYFEHNGRKLHYVDVDKRTDKNVGTPLLFVHGAGSSHLAWALQLRELSQDYRVIAIDLSGHGKSEDVEGPISIELHFTEDVTALVNHLELTDFVLIGHSMGGGVAMSYVLKKNVVQPRALVLVNTSSDLDLSKLARGLAKEAIKNRRFLFKNETFDKYTDTYQLKKAEIRLLMANPLVIVRDLAACNKFDITNRIGAIDIPTFVIVGENDDTITPSIAKELELALPRADIAVVKDADHAPMQEQPAEFNRLLKKFVTWAFETE